MPAASDSPPAGVLRQSVDHNVETE